eukprot:TRINITY_DN19122_c0_g1_i1.p1 TRINITY_DN19122_c0_g1~~TRINITY_DN19122_c0_g1_i1.p1  ORF type:complete len:1943 (-),score=331.98 TRINITY_DN19122_c0_g1_i1:185-6013(-)
MSCVNQGKMEKQKSIVEIYTDWANHYLEKTKGRKIKNLQTELSDGLILTEIIEAVTHQKVPDISKKPKTKDAMVTNIQACLNFLLAKGVAVEEIRPDEIHDGNMKAILGLFFQLSRYKQLQKQLNSCERPATSIPSSPAKYSSIPVPGSQNNSPKKINNSSKNLGEEKRSGIKTFRPSTYAAGNGAAEHPETGVKNQECGISKPTAGKKFMQSQGVQSTLPKADANGGKQSMLQRFKMGKPSNTSNSPIKPGLGKRTSSSSGFSSARSDRSESSISLSSDTNFPSPSALRRIQENEQVKQLAENQKSKLGIRSRLSKTQGFSREKSSSPKRSPKLGRGETEIKDYGMIDKQSDGQTHEKIRNYPPHAYSRSNSGINLKHTNISSQALYEQKCESPKINQKAIISSGIPSPRVKPPAPPLRSVQSTDRMTPNINSTVTQELSLENVQSLNEQNRQKQELTKVAKDLEIEKSKTQSGQSELLTKDNPIESEVTVSKDPISENCKTNGKPPSGIVSPIPASEESISNPDPSMTSSFHSRTCSLPRQRRLGDSSPSPNVAIVSPMPNMAKSKSVSESPSGRTRGNSSSDTNREGEENDDPLRGIAPMAPLGGFSGRSSISRPAFSPYDMTGERTHNIQTVNTSGLLSGPHNRNHQNPAYQDISSGYLSDSNICRARANVNTGYISEGGADFNTRGQCHVDDGYTSEGGAQLYNRKAQQRLAYEQQRSAAEAEHKKYLEMSGKLPPGSQHQGDQRNGRHSTPPHQPLPQVLSRQGENKPTYKVVGGRKNVKKADSGIQTETSAHKQLSQQQEHWRAAIEHNKNVLSNQEQEMKEYLRRQQKVAEKHIQQYSPAAVRKNANKNDQSNSYGAMSMPGTPLGMRKNKSGNQEMLQFDNNGHPRKINNHNGHNKSNFTRGGSLERHTSQMMHMKECRRKVSNEAYSDSEYMRGKFEQHPPILPERSPKEQRIHNSKSLPKRTSALNYGLLLGQIQQKRQQRQNKSIDGSISDSNYSSYSEIQGMRGGSKSPYQWMQPSSTYSGWSSAHEENLGSNESLNSVSSSIKQARANSSSTYQHIQGFSPGTKNNKIQEETEYYGIPFLLKKNAANNRIISQPTSPTHQDPAHCQAYSLNRMSSGQTPINYSSLPSYSSSSKQKQKMYSSEHNEDLNGSNVSLVSNGSSIYSNQEDKTNADIAKLQRELNDEHKKVINLTSQLATNAHVVSAFEQSLANMTNRLQQITKTAERKDSELNELRRTIDKLRQTGADAGLIKMKRQDSGSSNLLRQQSRGSVNSLSSALSNTSLNSGDEKEKGNKQGGGKRTGWLRSSFSKAFSKSKLRHKSGSVSDCDDGFVLKKEDNSNSDAKHCRDEVLDTSTVSISDCNSSTNIDQSDDEDFEPEIVVELKKQLIEKDTLLTETRLEALSSVHQLESLKETVNKMKTELTTLRQDNEKLHTQAVNKSLGSSESSLNTSNNELDAEKRVSIAISETSVLGGPSTLDMSGTTDPSNQDSKSVSIVVSLSQSNPKQVLKIGTIAAGGKLSWKLLDSLVERLFMEYIMLVDPVANLGLSSESLNCYQIGEISRKIHDQEPELLPYGYIIGDIRSIRINLHNSDLNGGVDALAFETLIPKSIIQRYISLTKEHKHVIICGPPSTGKTYIAGQISEFLAGSKENTGLSPRIDSFTLQRENVNELNIFLDKIKASQSSSPHVIILNNLHHAPNLDHLLEDLLPSSLNTLPYIIGTMTQTAGTTTDLQLRCNFRWILFANHVEPVRGYLGRYLKRKLLAVEVDTRSHNSESYEVIEWVSKAFVVINKFLESHCSQDATLSPSDFLRCPLDVVASRLWFINLWNLNIVPHILDSVREGLLLYGKRSSWDDPVKYLLDTWPWQNPPSGQEDLSHIRPNDVGYDTSAPLPNTSRPLSAVDKTENKEDPLFNMLMTLQEAANTQAGHL